MKKIAIIKAIASISIIVLGIVGAILGVYGYTNVGGYRDDYKVIDYEYYGGDAYTGIQHAISDTSENINIIGLSIDFFRTSVIEYISVAMVIGSILIAFLGLYMLTYALKDLYIEKTKQQSTTMDNNIHDPYASSQDTRD